MFTWLFGKESKEQKQKKDVDNIVKAMCKSVTEEGRWSVTVWKIGSRWKLEALRDPILHNTIQTTSYNIVKMKDTKTGWQMTFKVANDSLYTEQQNALGGIFFKRVGEDKATIVTDREELLLLKHKGFVFCVDVHDKHKYEDIPSNTQLEHVYNTWWQHAVGDEQDRRWKEKQQQKLGKKQTAIDKLKQMYL